MGFREFYRKITEHPFLASFIACSPITYLAGKGLYDVLNLSFEERGNFDLLTETMKFSAAGSFLLLGSILSGTRGLTLDKETKQKIKECRKRAQKEQTSSIKDKVKIGVSLKDFAFYSIFSNYGGEDRNRYAKYARKNKSPDFLVSAIRSYITHKELDEALVCVRDVLDMLGGMPKLGWKMWPEVPLLKLDETLTIARSPEKVESYLYAAANNIIRNPKKSWYWSSVAKEIATELESPLEKEAYLFDALLATTYKRSDEKQAWKESIDLLVKEEGEKLGESRNPVWRITDSEFFANTIVFKGNKNREHLVKEWKAAESLDSILNGFAEVPQPLHITEEAHDDLYVYVMRYLPGETLYDQLERNDKSGIEKVTPILAKIQVHYPIDELEKISLGKKIEAKLFAENFNIPENLTITILNNMGPVNQAIEQHAIWGADKDAHSGNWEMLKSYLTSVEVGVLDTEIFYSHPVILDIVNLLEYTGELSFSERRNIVMKSALALNKEGAAANNQKFRQAYTDHKLLMRAYDNGVIHRMICFASAWSAPERKSMHDKRKEAMSRAIRAIDDLQRDDFGYYKQNEKSYRILKKSFEWIRENLS